MTYWRAVCGESRKHGSEGGGWKRTGASPRHLAGRLPYAYSTAVSKTEQDEVLLRLRKLHEAIIVAREEANLLGVEPMKMGDAIMKYVFGDTTA